MQAGATRLGFRASMPGATAQPWDGGVEMSQQEWVLGGDLSAHTNLASLVGPTRVGFLTGHTYLTMEAQVEALLELL